jgi:RHS repeat-associated protein
VNATCFDAAHCVAVGGATIYGNTAAGSTGWQPEYTSTRAYQQYAAATCVTAQTCFVVGGYSVTFDPGEIAKTTNGGATWSITDPHASGGLSGRPGPLGSISCASTLVCLTATSTHAINDDDTESTAIITTDGGTTWSASSFSGYMDKASAASCMPNGSDTLCLLVGALSAGGPALASYDVGTNTWTSLSVPSGVTSVPTSISCPSLTFCVATAGSSLLLFDGTSWQTTTAPSGFTNVAGGTVDTWDSVSCVSTTCWVTGHSSGSPHYGVIVDATYSSGSWGTWTTQSLPTGFQDPLGPLTVSCYGGSTTGCVATDANTDGVASWIEGQSPQLQMFLVPAVSDLACADVEHCVAALGSDGGLVQSNNGGATWGEIVPDTSGHSLFQAVSCGQGSSLAACVAVGSDVTSTHAVIYGDSGGSWQAQSVPTSGIPTGDTLATLSGLSCAGSSTPSCVATGSLTGSSPGGVLLGTSNGGSTWTVLEGPIAINTTNAVDCVDASNCFVSGSGSSGAATVYVGSPTQTTWTAQTVTAATDTLAGVSCVASGSTDDCWVADTTSGQVWYSATAGQSWTSETTGVQKPTGISCVTTQICYLTATNTSSDAEIVATANAGSSWQQQWTATTSNASTSWLTCEDATECWSSGSDLYGDPFQLYPQSYQHINQGLIISLSDVSALVAPQGGPPSPAELYGGGAPDATPCSSCSNGASVLEPPAGDPINTASGDTYETSTDLTVPGGGLPLAFTRSYDAAAAQAQAAAGSPGETLGFGWSYNLGMQLVFSSSRGSNGIATVTTQDGAQIGFAPYVSGSSPPWCNATMAYCPTAPRTIATLSSSGTGADQTWSYTPAAAAITTYTFGNATGGFGLCTTVGTVSTCPLDQASDPSGNTLTAAAESPGTGQCPTAATTCTVWSASPGSGKTLTLAFGSSGQITSVIDPGGNTVALCYYTQTSCGAPSSGIAQDLYSITDPGGVTSTFTYDPGNSQTTLQHDLTLITTPAGTITNQYDTDGRVTEQTDPSSQVTKLLYPPNPQDNLGATGGDTTVETFPQGLSGSADTSVYSYGYGELVANTSGYGTAGQSTSWFNRDPVTLLATTIRDGDGYATSETLNTYSSSGSETTSADVLTQTDALGQDTTQASYTSFNEPWCTVDAADTANGTTCPSSPPGAPPSPGVTDPNLGATISFYNSSDQLTAVTDALGNTTAFSYTSGVSGVPNGLKYCSVDPVDYQNSVTCPAYGANHVTGTTTATFDSAGDKTSSTDADGNTTTYLYNVTGHPGLVSSQTDPDATTTTFTYNAMREVTAQVVSFGSYSATTLFAYDSLGRKFCEVDPYEAALSVTCPTTPPSSPPTPSNDPYLGATITTYDADGRVVQATNAVGGITYTAYDAAGEAFCTVAPFEAALAVTCPSSAPSSPPTIGSDPYLGATITTYDANERVIQVTNPLGGITLSAYDGASNVIQTTVESNNATSDPNVVTENTYDADNRVTSTTVGYGSSVPATTLSSYDPNGNVFCSVSANAVAAGTTAYQCPAWQTGWIASPPSPSTLYSTTPTFAQANNVTTTFFNAGGQQLQSTNPDVQTTITVVDGDGRAYCNSDPVNVSAWLTSTPSSTYPYLCPSTPPTTAPTGTTTGYTTTIFDPAGRTSSSTDQVGDTTTDTYDPAGHQLTVTDPRGKITTSCYYFENGTGQCAAAAPAGGGSGDDLYSKTTPATAADPSGETTTTTYYPGDEVHVTTTPAGTTTDTYDALLDLTGVAYSNTASGYATPANVSSTFNADGSRHTMTDGTGTTTYTDDAMGDVTQQQFSATGSGLTSNTVKYSYFTTGTQASVTYPSYGSYSNAAATYSYDPLGNMAQVTDWLGNKVTFTHDQDGNLTAQDNAVTTGNPNGTSSTASSYDNADLNTQASSTLNCSGTNGTLTQSFAGTNGSRNADGQVTQDSASYGGSCAGPAPSQRNYSYDAAGRVVYQGTTVQGSNANTVAYDASGDPTTISSHDTSGNFDTYTQVFDSAGEIQSQTPISGSHGVTSTYTSDTAGDQTQAVAGSTTSAYGFNQIGQMTSVGSSSSSTYQYTGDGLEAATTVPANPWSAPASIDSGRYIASVSCPTSSFCVAVDGSGNALKYNGTSWSAPSNIDSGAAIAAVSCTSSSFCEAVDGSGHALKYNGSTWSSSKPDANNALESVSCVSSSFCVAVDSYGHAFIYTGSWSSAKKIDNTTQLDSVSCASSSFCEAVDVLGHAVKYNGSTWTQTPTIDSSGLFTSISCPSTTFCAAVDFDGHVVTYNGSTWSSVRSIDPVGLQSIACTSSTFCAVVDPSGGAVIYNGTTWASAVTIDTTALDSVSCPSSAFCQVVDYQGNALTYRPSTVTSQLSWDTNSSLSLVLSDSANDYIYGPTGQPVEQVALSSSTPTFLSYTPSNSSWLATSGAGQQLGYWRYDAFGTLEAGTPVSPFGYAGQYTDATSGFSNMRARWYDAQTGAFTTRDPAFSRTDQAYGYANGDPVNSSDPSGKYASAYTVPKKVNNGGITLTVHANFADAVDAAKAVHWGNGYALKVLEAYYSDIIDPNSAGTAVMHLENTNTQLLEETPQGSGGVTATGCEVPNAAFAFACEVVAYEGLKSTNGPVGTFDEFRPPGQYPELVNDNLAYYTWSFQGLSQVAFQLLITSDFGSHTEFYGLSPSIFQIWKAVRASPASYTTGDSGCISATTGLV